MAFGGLHERLRAAEAEADRDHALGVERGDRGGDVLGDGLRAGLEHVRPELEALVARAEPGGAAEVVDRDRRMSGGGEALGELLVEAEQAADVGEHDDARRAFGAGQVGRELGAVGGGERQVLTGGSAGDHVKAGREVGHDRVEGEAHGSETYICRDENGRRHRRRARVRRSRPSSCGTTRRGGRPGSTATAISTSSRASGRSRARGASAGRATASSRSGWSATGPAAATRSSSRTRGSPGSSACASKATRTRRGSPWSSTSNRRSGSPPARRWWLRRRLGESLQRTLRRFSYELAAER